MNPAVCLLDLNLPNVNSLWACEEIRRTTPSTKVIVLTGGLDPGIRGDVLAAGASACLEKSAAPHELLTAINDTQSQ